MIIPAKKGPDVGKDHTQLSDESLAWWAANAQKADLKAACLEEQRRRQGGGKPANQTAAPAAAAAASTAVTTRSSTDIISGTFRDAKKATEALLHAQQVAHLVAPATVCGTLPEGCEVALALVMVDAEHETYPVGDKLALGKTALERIAAAAGVSWDPILSQRLDDASHPQYCHFRAVGYVRGFDGQARTLPGEVEIDARDGSPQIEEIRIKAAKKNRDPAPQILELRKFLLRHAESKAKNRAVRSLGVRTSYEPQELQKPFVVAKLMFTGASDDPAARQYFRGRIADAFLGASSALYGGDAQPQLSQPEQRTAITHQPPLVGSVHDPDDADGFVIETSATPAVVSAETTQGAPANVQNKPDVFAPLRERVNELAQSAAGASLFTKMFGDTAIVDDLTGKQLGEFLDAMETTTMPAQQTSGHGQQSEMKL